MAHSDYSDDGTSGTITILVVIGIIAFLALTFAIQTFTANIDPNRIPVHNTRTDGPQWWTSVLRANRQNRQGDT
jgi:hypothetical protein